MLTTLDLKAPAKVNLTLEVLSRLPNGYHELDSWMHKVSLFDHLSFDIAHHSGIHLSCSDPSLPCDENNLIHKAADQFYREIGKEPKLAISLQKNIPTAAGLGGGSSDCAATLKGLNYLHGNLLSQERLLELGKGLGADVPFFIHPSCSARARGIGEQLSELAPLADCFVVLVNPGFAVSTKWVFENLQKNFTDSSLRNTWENSPKTANYALTTGGKTYNLGRASERCFEFKLVNDLEQVTIANYAEILVVKEFLLANKSCGALMSGSGPTVFGLFLDENNAYSCIEAMKADYPHWNSFVTVPLRDDDRLS
ncbi:MAG: 4-(cytidine 5'-diphospho)-2-C-methyl-D-erythritol kinase [Thermodesulfobacteriota bacterium]